VGVKRLKKLGACAENWFRDIPVSFHLAITCSTHINASLRKLLSDSFSNEIMEVQTSVPISVHDQLQSKAPRFYHTSCSQLQRCKHIVIGQWRQLTIC
jgi:hypothetical protein